MNVSPATSAPKVSIEWESPRISLPHPGRGIELTQSPMFTSSGMNGLVPMASVAARCSTVVAVVEESRPHPDESADSDRTVAATRCRGWR